MLELKQKFRVIFDDGYKNLYNSKYKDECPWFGCSVYKWSHELYKNSEKCMLI